VTLLRHTGAEFGSEAVNYWTGAGGIVSNATNPRTGARSWEWGGANNGPFWDLTAGEEDDGIITGWAPRPFSTANQRVRFSGDGGTVLHVDVKYVQATRSIEFYRGVTLVLASPAGAFDMSVYTQWQIKIKIAAAGGLIEIRKQGQSVPFLSFTGNTRNGGVDALCDRVQYYLDGSGAANRFDDAWLCNEQGIVNNDYLGDGRVYGSFVTADGDVIQLTPSAGLNFQNVDENPDPNDADFNGHATVGLLDTYAMGDVPVPTGSIPGVLLCTRAFKSDAGAKQGRRIIRRAAVNNAGADLALGTSPGPFFELLELDPHAGPGAWTIANYNSTQLGFEVRT
jgi:hypothetical protein